MSLRESDTYNYKTVDDRRIKTVPLAYGQCMVQGTIIRSSYMNINTPLAIINPSVEASLTGWGGDGTRLAYATAKDGAYVISLEYFLSTGEDDTKVAWYHQADFIENTDYTVTLWFKYYVESSGWSIIDLQARLFFYDEVGGVGAYDYAGAAKIDRTVVWRYTSGWKKLTHTGSFRASSTAASRRVGIEILADNNLLSAHTDVVIYLDLLGMGETGTTETITAPHFLVAACQGEIASISEDGLWVEGQQWSTLAGSEKSATLYTGTADQTADARFSDETDPQAFRGIAYAALTIPITDDFSPGTSPTVEIEGQWRLCTPIGGGDPVFTTNPGVILYDFYITRKGIAAAELEDGTWGDLAEYCEGRYEFNYAWDAAATVDEQEALICKAFFGQVVRSQAYGACAYKPVWLHAQGAVYAFNDDNTQEDLPKLTTATVPNIVRVIFKDAANDYLKSSVELRDEIALAAQGEILKEEECFYITDVAIARRRVQLLYDLAHYCATTIEITSSRLDASLLELYDTVSYTNAFLGWTGVLCYVAGKTLCGDGLCEFKLNVFALDVMHESTPEDPRQLVWLGDVLGEVPAPTGLVVREAGRTSTIIDIYAAWTPPAGYLLPLYYQVTCWQGATLLWSCITEAAHAHIPLGATGTYLVQVQALHYYWMTRQALSANNSQSMTITVGTSGTVSTRSLSANIAQASATPAIIATLERTLSAAIAQASATPAISATVVRSLSAAIAQASATPDITGTIT